jgi:hypothetical protein
MVALMMVVILGMAAFAIDLSGFYFDQRHLQMQADSGVLAAANQFVAGLNNCSSSTFQQQVKQTFYNYADSAQAGASGIASNGEKGTVNANVQVNCAPAYIDATLTNSNPPTFFSHVLGAGAPSISVHARASLEQVSQEGGSQVMPYAITQSQATYTNKLIQLVINPGANQVSQAVVCDGSGATNASGTAGTTAMYNLQVSGCPVTQVNPGGSTCPPTALSPPSCLYEFSNVDEGNGFDAGHIKKLEGLPWPAPPGVSCANPSPVPTNNYAQYQATGTLPANDPRAITVYVVPDGSLTTTPHLVPIIGYAEFYLAGWDHDPCELQYHPPGPGGGSGSYTEANPGSGAPDPANPGPQGDAGTVWGYFISYVNPESSNVQGSGPCNPNPNYAYTYNCTYALTQ